MFYVVAKRIFLFFIFVVLFSFSLAEAKDLTYRAAIGFKDNSSESVPSVAGIYYPTKDYAFTASFGYDGKQLNNKMHVSAGLRYIIFFENNLNFYGAGQLGFASYESAGTGKTSGAEVLALVGAEFFFSGLENLAFAMETGIGVSTVGSTRVRTLADHPLRAGVYFYF